MTLSSKTQAKNSIIKRQFTPRSLLLSKMLRKKRNNKATLTNGNKPEKTERKTMMYVDPNSNEHHSNHHHEGSHHGGHHESDHSRPRHHSKVPEGYYRCSHGCLCKKGVNHQEHDHGQMHGQMHGGMQGGMQPMMNGGMQGGMNPMMGGGMNPMMGGGMSPMQPAPTANNPLINTVGNMGNGLMGMLGQGMGVANGLNQQFTSLAARMIIIIYYYYYFNY